MLVGDIRKAKERLEKQYNQPANAGCCCFLLDLLIVYIVGTRYLLYDKNETDHTAC